MLHQSKKLKEKITQKTGLIITLQRPYNIEEKYNTQKLIKKKIESFNTKLTASIGKLKELWKSLKNFRFSLSQASLKKHLP